MTDIKSIRRKYRRKALDVNEDHTFDDNGLLPRIQDSASIMRYTGQMSDYSDINTGGVMDRFVFLKLMQAMKRKKD